MFFTDVAESAGITNQDLIVLLISVQSAAHMTNDRIAFESHLRTLSGTEVERHEQAKQVLLSVTELLRSTDTLKVLEILETMARYALTITDSPLCDTHDNCRACWGCSEWRRRNEDLQHIAFSAAGRTSLLHTSGPIVACPGCGLLVPETEMEQQGFHLQKRHPEIIDERRRAAGFVKGRDGQWHDGWASD